MNPTIDANKMIEKLKAQISELAVAVAIRDVRIEEILEQLNKSSEETA